MLPQLGWQGNCDGEWIFCWKKEAGIALFLQVTRIRKIKKICEANLTTWLSLKTEWSQSNEPWNTKKTKRFEIHQSQMTNHDRFELVQRNMSFLTGLLRWLTEQKTQDLINAQHDITNFAVKAKQQELPPKFNWKKTKQKKTTLNVKRRYK